MEESRVGCEMMRRQTSRVQGVSRNSKCEEETLRPGLLVLICLPRRSVYPSVNESLTPSKDFAAPISAQALSAGG